MQKLFLTSIVTGSLLFLMPLPVQSDQDGVVRFATLPQSSPGNPEGIAADERILKLNLMAGVPTTLETFTESINGADGILFDEKGRLWVAANQADEVVALNAGGRVVERRGSFGGVGRDGAPRGLLFPASIVLSHGSIFVTNTALVLTPAVGDEPEEDVTTFTVSRIPIGAVGP